MQTEKIINHIVDWLKDYLTESGQKGFVVGISGGIDSAVVSALCARTGYPLLCLDLPIHQPEYQVKFGQAHIQSLKESFDNVSGIQVNLSSVYDEFTQVTNVQEDTYENQLSLANTRSRLRMTALYYYAGLHHYLVAGTGNKIEDFGIGFFTKYGDGGVDLSPIGDLMKSEVYKLGRVLGISDDILKTPPTDGLFNNNRSDEDQIGATYDELEWAMKLFEKGHKSIEFEGREREVFEIFEKRNQNNRHKIEPIPVCMIPENLKS